VISTNLLWCLTPSSFLLAPPHMRDGAILLPSMSCYALTAALWAAIALTIDRAFDPLQATSTREAKQPCRCREPPSCMPRCVVPPELLPRPSRITMASLACLRLLGPLIVRPLQTTWNRKKQILQQTAHNKL